MQFTWEFPQFIVSPYYDGLTNVVTAINWVCTGTDGLVSSSSSGTVRLGTPNPAEFVPYDQITQAMAFQWVSDSISIPGVEANIALQIQHISAPQVQPQSPPYGK
jgi:hypothetical protein